MGYPDLKNKLLYWIPKILIILLGVFFIIFGGYDDSPGLQGIGLIIIIATLALVVKNRKQNFNNIIIFKNLLKNKTIIIAITSFALGSLIYNYSTVIFQEGNPWPQIEGIAQLTFGNNDVVKLNVRENKYITKSNNSELIKSFMKDKGYDFTEQMGSGYLFKSQTGTSAVATHRYYSRFYSLWIITEFLATQDDTLADELEECLPKSDMASHKRCEELLAEIRNFNDCINAGFPAIKLNPPQCETPDGRKFTDETNSDWNMVLAVLDNCEAKSVFQTHNKLVTLKLKNGDKIAAYEPEIDDIMKAVKNLNGKCGNIMLATE